MRVDKTQLLSWAKFLIGWPLSAVSIIFIIKLIIDKSNELNISFEKINLTYLFLSVALFFIYYLLRSFLWQTELREKGFKIPFKKNTYAFTFSELKRYAPGNIWSFLSRGYQFSKLGVDKKTIGISILADIQLVIIGCGIISLFSVPWLIDSSSELQTKLATLLPASLLAIIIFFVVTSFIYTKKYLKTNSKSILLHSSGFWTNFLLPGFTFNSKIKLSVLAIITYFIFGIGNYFAFISIYQTIGNPLIISSFFVFSLLVGFLSFITPMGLGVREAITTLGLSKIMSLADAGAVSIFTRIILVISELSFLVLVFLWQKSSKK